MKRREWFKTGTALALAVTSEFAQTPIAARSRVGASPLKITKIEPFVIRTPKDDKTPEELIVMPPVGNRTGGEFRQELKLREGFVKITGRHGALQARINVWADVFNPVIHIEVKANQLVQVVAAQRCRHCQFEFGVKR